MFDRVMLGSDYYPVLFVIISRYLFYGLGLAALLYTGFELIVQLRKKNKEKVLKQVVSFILVVIICIGAFVSTDSLPAHAKTSNISTAVTAFKEIPEGLYELDMGYCKGEVYIIDYENNSRVLKEIAYIDGDVKNYDGVYFTKSPYEYERHYKNDFVNGVLEGVGGEVALGFDNRLIVVGYRYFQGNIGLHFRGIVTLDLFFRPRLDLVKVSKNLTLTDKYIIRQGNVIWNEKGN